ncbi:hypothetical protein BaRGS_00028285, partial [Batillaria attramentaria]
PYDLGSQSVDEDGAIFSEFQGQRQRLCEVSHAGMEGMQRSALPKTASVDRRQSIGTRGYAYVACLGSNEFGPGVSGAAVGSAGLRRLRFAAGLRFDVEWGWGVMWAGA